MKVAQTTSKEQERQAKDKAQSKECPDKSGTNNTCKDI